VSCSTTKLNSNYWNIPPDLTQIVYEGGDGSSVENAIVIKNATTERDGIAAEYAYIEKKREEKFKDWKPIQQATNVLNGKHYDAVSIQIISDNTTEKFIFDITNFYGKF
jgi:hypothetical protein